MVCGDLLAVAAAAFDDDLVQRIGRRSFADRIDEPAGRQLSVKHRRRTAQQLDALQSVRLLPAVELRRLQLHAVAQHAAGATAGVEATDVVVVGDARKAVRLADDAVRIAERIGDGIGTAQRHLLGADHGDRLRRLAQRRVGLERGAAAVRHVAVDRAGGSRLRRFGRHRDFVQRHGSALRRALQRQRQRGTAAPDTQSAAAHQLGQRIFTAALAGHGVRSQAVGQTGREDDLHIGLAREQRQRGRQRLRRNVEDTERGRSAVVDLRRQRQSEHGQCRCGGTLPEGSGSGESNASHGACT